MTTVYPGAIDSFSVKVDGVDDVMAAHVNDLQDSVVAIETDLAAGSSGSPQSVLINGNFNVWQRGTSFAAMADGQYMADRFGYFKTGAMVHTGSRDTDVPTVAQSAMFQSYSLLIDCTTVDSSIAAGDYCYISHVIEGYDWQHLAQRAFTLSFWVKATKTGTYCVAFGNSGFNRSFVKEYTISAADTWEYKTIAVLASPTAGTWDYTAGAGLRIFWTLASGSTFHTTADDWQTGIFIATSNQVNACDNTANNFRLALVQIQAGSVGRPFIFQGYQATLARCQRYAWVIESASATIAVAFGAMISATAIHCHTPLPVPMRAAPTLAHNVTAYTAGDPGTTTIGLYDSGLPGYHTITGALTVALFAANTQNIMLSFTAGTSWNGVVGYPNQLRIGPSVKLILSAEV